MDFILFFASILFLLICFIVSFVFLAWVLAHYDIFFTLPAENTGYAIVTWGDTLIDIRVVGDQNIEKTGNFRDWEIVARAPHESKYSEGLFGFLEAKIGMYWTGFWPFRLRYRYEMYRTVFNRGSDNSENAILRRNNESNFFYAQPVEYAFELRGAETGIEGSDKEAGGNIPVDVKFAVFLQIKYPYVALFDNPVWFERASSIIFGHARKYVGNRRYEDLRSDGGEGSSSNESAFSNYMSKLNTNIPGEDYGFLKALGVEIVGAAIRTVDISAEVANEVRKATLIRYTTAEEAAGIRKIGKANAEVLGMDVGVTESSPVGPFVRRQRAIEASGNKGNTIVFDSGKDNESMLGYLEHKFRDRGEGSKPKTSESKENEDSKKSDAPKDSGEK